MDDAFRKRLAACERLTSLPGAVVELTSLSANPEAGITDAYSIISKDPALSAQLLKIANCPLFKRGRQLDDLRDALFLLGLDHVISFSISFSLMNSLERTDTAYFDSRKYWQRSLLAAIASQELGRRLGVSRRGPLFLAALLQDIGILALMEVEHDRYTSLLGNAESHAQLAALELDAFGFTHAQVGAELLRGWNMPDALADAIEASHPLQCLPREGKDSGICSLTGWLADICMGDMQDAPSELMPVAGPLGLDEQDLCEILQQIVEVAPTLSGVFKTELMSHEDSQRVEHLLKQQLVQHQLKMLASELQQKSHVETIERRVRTLEELTRRDELTGLLNRRHMDNVLEAEFRTARNTDSSLSVAFIDIDFFKQVNDTHGHAAGDVVLRQLAGHLNSQKRVDDLLARYGGEEFVMVMPTTQAEDARTVALRLQESLQHFAVALPSDERLTLTVSIGLATQSVSTPYSDYTQLLAAADKALYVGKQRGRNQVVDIAEALAAIGTE